MLWNPWVAKAARMGDFGDAEYKAMLCLEPGRVSRPHALAPGAAWSLSQHLQFRTNLML